MRIAAMLLEPRMWGYMPRRKPLAKIVEPEDMMGEGALLSVAMPARNSGENLLKRGVVVRRIILRILMFDEFCASTTGLPCRKAILGTACPMDCIVLIIAGTN